MNKKAVYEFFFNLALKEYNQNSKRSPSFKFFESYKAVNFEPKLRKILD